MRLYKNKIAFAIVQWSVRTPAGAVFRSHYTPVFKTIFISSIFFFILQFAIGQKVDVYKRPVQTERSHDFDAIHYKITLDVDLNKKTLEGENQISLSPLNDHFETVIIDAAHLIVSSVIDIDGKELKFEQKNNQVLINLNRSYSHRDTLQLSVKYKLDTQVPGLNFIQATAVNPLMVSSDCFPNKARQWIPCYDYPNDKATTEMIVTVDKKYKVLSNGRLVNVKENDSLGTVTYHWSQELPFQLTLLISASQTML